MSVAGLHVCRVSALHMVIGVILVMLPRLVSSLSTRDQLLRPVRAARR